MLQGHGRFTIRAAVCAALGSVSCGLISPAAPAQVQSESSSDPSQPLEEVVVTGYREAVRSALDEKRKSDAMVDVIKAEDIADFPDANLAESLQRLPGVSIDRDNGEGRTITVRGLGSDFTRVRLNGMETLSTAGSNDAGSNPNRSRGFDFNTFASELFNSLKVQKTATAEVDEGSLGATVDLTTGRPLDFKRRQIAFSAQDAYYEIGGSHNPRLAGLVADQWFEGRLGALVSAAYNTRSQNANAYRRSPGHSDYLYRGGSITGVSGSTLMRGFAVPGASMLPAAITNPAARAALSGSNPSAYAQLNELTIIPALPAIEESELEQDRLGLTSTLQWQPTDRTLLTLDAVYSRYSHEQINYQISPVGLNRNNTNASYNTATAATSAANRRRMYNTCTSRAQTETQDSIDCGEQLYGNTPVFAGGFSLNPNNLEPYEYYNNPASVGYRSDPSGRGLAYRDALIGRPTVRVLDSHVNEANQADYLVLNNVDFRSSADASFNTTRFKQGTFNLQHELTDRLKVEALYGRSRSTNDNQGLLAEFNRLDSPGNFVYDERGGGSMPRVELGFDATNPNSWVVVKGFSALRNTVRFVKNEFETARVDLAFAMNDKLTFVLGASVRDYTFETMQRRRLTGETLNPSLLELGRSVSSMSKVASFGQGIDAPLGTPTSFIVPDLDAFRQAIGFDCGCINQWGDWRLSALSTPENNYDVKEADTSYYTQINFGYDVLGRPLRGNLGVRYALTDLEANGFTPGSRPVVGTNDYTDTLPSLNLVYAVMPDVLLRFATAKVMARPLLGNLAPTISQLSVPTNGNTVGGSITLGNPTLEPFRGKNFDFGAEWYFARGAVLSAAYFTKKIDSYPQTVISSQPLSSFLDTDTIAQIRAQQTDPNSIAYVDADNPFDVRQFRSAPGGDIKGFELVYQQDLTFLPGFFRNFGVQANYTHIHSELQYIIDPGTSDGSRPQLTQIGPWTGASPDAFNFTVYYETKTWSARVSSAYRKKYITAYPLAAGSCEPGVCDSPLINDFIGNEATLSVDASTSYRLSDNIRLTFEALNLTNQPRERWAYADSPLVTEYGSTGRQYFAGLRMKF